jgi:hypothetical protein
MKRTARVELRPLQDTLPLGVALVLAIAGLAVALDAFSAAIVAAIIACGVACALVELGRRAPDRQVSFRGRVLVIGLGALLVGAVLLLSSWETASFAWNACDDDVSYLYLAKRLVLRGDLLDPLNNRRLTSLGGMSALQALFLFRLPDAFLPVADLLLGSLLILVGLWRTRSGRWSGWGIAVAFVVILFHGSLGGLNTSPVLLPVGLTLAGCLFAVKLRAEALAPRAELATACALGLVVGAAAALRPQYGLPLGLLALAAVSWPPPGLGVARRLVGLSMGLGAAVAGWSVASWRAVGTPMFPIFTGNLDPTWPANGPAVKGPSPLALLGRVVEDPITRQWCLALLGATCLAVYLVRRSGEHGVQAHWGVRMHVAAAACCVLWIGLLTYLWWGLGTPGGYARFWAPIALACVLLPTALTNSDHIYRRPLTTASGFAALLLVGTVTVVSPGLAASSPLRVAADTISGRTGSLLDMDRYAAQRGEYRRAAALVPPGARVLAAVDVPSLLMSQGFDVDTIDLVGSTSPPPHLPYFQGTEVKLSWLRAHGYQYVIALDPTASACLYNRSRQAQDLAGERGQPYQAWAPYYFDWFQFLADLSSRPGSTRAGSLIVVKV